MLRKSAAFCERGGVPPLAVGGGFVTIYVIYFMCGAEPPAPHGGKRSANFGFPVQGELSALLGSPVLAEIISVFCGGAASAPSEEGAVAVKRD